MKRVVFLLFLLLTCSLYSEQAVTWNKINKERIRDVKNIFIDSQDAIYYSSYNADDNKWGINFSQDYKTFTQMAIEGVPSAEKFIKHGNSLYVIAQNGAVYHYDVSASLWLPLPIPANYLTNDILFTQNKMFLLPKFGFIYSSTDNGSTWTKVNEIQLYEQFYYGMNFDNQIYLLRGNTIFYSADEGTSWNFVFPPQGIESFTDIDIHNNQLYLVDNDLRIYRLENNQLTQLGTFNKPIYSFTINSDGAAIILSDKAVYKSGADFNTWNKVYDLYDAMPSTATYILKNRKIKKNNTIYFAIPPNDIIYSENNGTTWKILKKDMQGVNCKLSVTNSQNSVFALTDKKLFESVDRCKSWYEINSPVADNTTINRMITSSNNTLIADVTDDGIYIKYPDEDIWTPENTGLPSKNIKDFSINSNGIIFALTELGLYKSQLPDITWESLGSNLLGDRVICLSNNKTYLIADRLIKEIDNSGGVVTSFDLSGTLTTKIKDLEINNNLFWIATEGEGIYVYNPVEANPLRKITKGIITDNFVDLTYQNNVIWGYDNINNIYISNNQKDYFQINNISSVEGIQINSMDKTYDNKMLVSIKNNGLFIADEVDLSKFNTQYVWLNNKDFFQHNFIADKYDYINISTTGKSLFTVCQQNDTSFYKEIDLKTGALVNEMPISYQVSTIDCGDIYKTSKNYDLSFSQRYLASSFNNCENSKTDSVYYYDIISNSVGKKINSIPDIDTNNTIEKIYPSKMLITSANQMLIATPIKWQAGNPPTSPVSNYYNTELNLVNTNNGSLVKHVTSTKFSNNHTGYITALALTRNKLYTVIAKTNKIDNTYTTNIDIIDPSINFIRNNIPVDNNSSVADMLFSTDNNAIIISKSNLVFNTPADEMAKYGEIAKYDITSKTMTGEIKNVNVVDMIYSADSLSFMFSCYKTEGTQKVGKVYIADFNTFRLTDSITTEKEYIGNMVVSDKSDYIAMTGSDGIIRLFKNPASVTQLKALFTTDKESINTNESIQFYNISTGNPQTYTWNFGDGETSNEFEPLHKYTKSGTYTVSLTISKNSVTDKMTKTSLIKVYDKLSIDFTANKVDGFNPLTVKFTNTSEGNADSWIWNFGDGQTSTEANPTHIYTIVGKFNVKLVGISSAEKDSLTKNEFINVDAVPSSYIVDFSSNTLEGEPNMQAVFTPNTTPSSTVWNWDFCDGTNSNEKNPTHIFSDYGSYSIKLTASKENYGNTKTKYGYITVRRDAIDNLIIDNEYEERIYNGNQVATGCIELAANHFIFDMYGDTSKNKFSGFYDIYNGVKEFRSVQMYGDNPTPRFMLYNGNNKLHFFTGILIENKYSTKVIQTDTLGNELHQFNITRPDIGLQPIATASDNDNYVLAMYASNLSLKIVKINSDNQYQFEKDFLAGSVSRSSFWKIVTVSDGYLVFYKPNVNDTAKVMKLSKTGDSLWTKLIGKDKNYWISDADMDEEGNFVISANYKYSYELSSLYSYIMKFNSNFDFLWEQKYSGSYSINTVKRFVTRFGDKYYFAAGKSIDKLAVFIITDGGSPKSFYQYNNRPGFINSITKTQDNSLMAVGSLMSSAGKNNLYALKISGMNTFSGIEDETNKGQSIEVYPNPAINLFTLKFNNETESNAVISIKNELGNEITNEQINLGLGEQNITLSSEKLNSGIYFIDIKFDNSKVLRTKIVINK